MNKKSENTREIQGKNKGYENLNKGKWKPGQSGNPKGKPKGSYSIVATLKRMMNEIPEENLKQFKETKDPKWKKTYGELITSTIMAKVIKDKDTPMMRDIINRIDGLPKNSIGINGDGEPITGINIIISKK